MSASVPSTPNVVAGPDQPNIPLHVPRTPTVPATNLAGANLRIAAVRYLNTLPLIEGLEKVGGVRVLPAVPSHIARMVLAREADVGLASIVDIARAQGARGGRLALLPAGCIGCDGATLTVRIYSAVPLPRVTQLHADTDSHTSVILAQLILRERYGTLPQLLDFDVRERVELNLAGKRPVPQSLESSWPEAVLMIGDKVVTDSPPAARYPHQLDLGEAWKQWTGLPFVYASWACMENDLSIPARAATLHLAADLLDRQRRHNATRLEWLVQSRAPQHRWPVDLARKYVGELLRYELTPAHLDAAHRFIAEAVRAGLLAPHARVQVASRNWTAGR